MKQIGRTVAHGYLVEMSEAEYIAFCALSELAAGSPMWDTWDERRYGSPASDLAPVFAAMCEFVSIQRNVIQAVEQLKVVRDIWKESAGD